MSTPSTVVRVNRDRLWSDLMQLKQIGSYHDEATGLEGVKRLALTDEDAEARRLVISWMTKAGMEVRIDQIGNVYPWRTSQTPRTAVGLRRG
jgi:N-carbamoyl-L-amino-acid hydrolase